MKEIAGVIYARRPLHLYQQSYVRITYTVLK